jgi:hypothetical protein
VTAIRPPKKSESLEIRIPYPAKQAFMARCRQDGTSASEALRALIDAHLEDEPMRPRPAPAQAVGPDHDVIDSWRLERVAGGKPLRTFPQPALGRTLLHLAAGALIAAAAGAVALPSLARPAACPAAAWASVTAPLSALGGHPPAIHLTR